MNKTTRNLTILILTSLLLLVCLVISAVWVIQNPEKLLPETGNSQQPMTFLSGILLPTPKPYDRPETRGGNLISSRVYDVSETIYINNTREMDLMQLNLYVAVINEIRPFQEILKMEINRDYTEIISDEHANRFVFFELGDIPPGSAVTIRLDYRIRVNEISFDTGDCQGRLPNIYTKSEQMIESETPQIIQLAGQLSDSTKDVCEISKNIYSYIGQNFDYQVTNEDAGALWMINNEIGDCTGFTETQVALSRAADIPARFIEGLLYLGDGDYFSSEIKHNWAEVYLPQNGWVPLDPTWGSLPGQEDLFFAHALSDRIILTYSRNLETLGGHHEYALDYTWLGEESPLPLEHYVIWGFKLITE